MRRRRQKLRVGLAVSSTSSSWEKERKEQPESFDGLERCRQPICQRQAGQIRGLLTTARGRARRLGARVPYVPHVLDQVADEVNEAVGVKVKALALRVDRHIAADLADKVGHIAD